LRDLLNGCKRFIGTPTLSKFRLFVWLKPFTLPDQQLIAFPDSSDFFFGILHSHFHEVWSLKQRTFLETRPRYTPTTCFETFPFPRPTPKQEAAIAAAAKELNALRERWLNPPEWTVGKNLEFPGSFNGAWARYVVKPDKNGVVTQLSKTAASAPVVTTAASGIITSVNNSRNGMWIQANQEPFHSLPGSPNAGKSA
jgi:hypothetical protein